MSSSASQPDIAAQIRRAIDPTGESLGLVDVVRDNPTLPGWLGAVAPGLRSAWSELASNGQKYEALLSDMEAAVRALVPRGWAVFNMDSAAIEAAVALADAGRGDAADDLLAAQWEGEGAWRTKRICDRLGVMGAGDNELYGWFRHRARLMRKAKEHHESGHYEASIPLIHNQMEGLVMDLTEGRKFFTKGTKRAVLIDPEQLVSIESSLSALQASYGQDVPSTQAAGGLSRHGIAHGRELTYDTRVNSAKAWSVLDALVEWGLPMARAETDRRRAARQQRNAGSADVDERGRRVDDREIAETRDALRLLATSAMGWWRQRGEFRADLIGGVYSDDDFRQRRLPIPHRLQYGLEGDGQSIWFWRVTVSGWVMSLALTLDGENFVEWLYAGPQEPSGSPLMDSGYWSTPFSSPPDWG